MSRRTLLSSEQRTRLFGIPSDAAEMATHYVLEPEDLALVRAKRRPSNRLGFAVQLCVLRRPGRPLDPSEVPPAPVLAFVANQLTIDPKLFTEYAHRAETRREHLVELKQALRLRSFHLADWRACLRVGANAAWATDRGEPIVQAMLAHLRAEGVLIPAAAVLERIGLAARVRARKRVFQVLADGLTNAAYDALEKLVTFDPAVRRSRFAWLRDYAESPAPANLLALLDRLDYVRGLGIDATCAKRIHPARLDRLLAETAVMTVQHIADLEPARRIAVLVAQVSELKARLADATLTMFEKYIGSLFSKAQNRDERRFQATKRDVAKALLLFRRTIAALKQAQQTGEDGVAVVDREVGLKRLDDVLPVIGSVAEVADQDILVTAAERYSVLRRFSPRFLAAFRFESNVPHDPVLAAIEALKAMNRDGARALPKRLPTSFLPPKWRKLIFANEVADRRLYETAVLATLRDRLRGSDIWVAGSRDYRAFEDYLVPAEAARNIGIDRETDPTRYMKARASALRMERTLFTLQWLSDPALRQRSHAGLNKGEASNSLRRAIFFHRQGEIRDRTLENQSFRASGLSLITAIVHWNTVYLDRAVRQLRTQDDLVPNDLLAHVAPLGWEHIALTGDYVWSKVTPPAEFRPLRDVRAAFLPQAA